MLYKLLSPPFWDDLDVDNMFPKVTEQILCSDQKTDDKAEVWVTRVINTIQILKDEPREEQHILGESFP